MKILLLQLSDIHIALPSDKILNRTDAIAAAARRADPSPNECWLMLSGDITNAGSAAEYALAQTFVDNLVSNLQKFLPGRPVRLFLTPGNHDCDLPESHEGMRAKLIEGYRASILDGKADPVFATQLLTAQDSFQQFHSSKCRTTAPTLIEKQCDSTLVTIGSKTIQVITINTSLSSRRKEQKGQLVVSIDELISQIIRSDAADMAIAMLHHPYGWIDEEFAITLRSHLESIVDLVITGHEHHAEAYLKTSSYGTRVRYLEGDVLQDRTHRYGGGFNCLSINLSQEPTVSYQLYRWNKDHYECKHESLNEPLELSSGPKFGFRPNRIFRGSLDDEEVGFRHPSSDRRLRLSEVFVYPDISLESQKLVQSSEWKSVDLPLALIDSHVLLTGAKDSGKTSLLKQFYRHLMRNTEKIPIMLPGSQANLADLKSLTKALSNAYSEQYDFPVSDVFDMLPPERSALLIDDCSLSSYSLEECSIAFEYMGGRFGTVVINMSGDLALYTGMQGTLASPVKWKYGHLKTLSYVLRGRIIEKWVRTEENQNISELQLADKIESVEKALNTVMGERTLPSLPYIVLFILQELKNSDGLPQEFGSFGHIYEQLVTRSLRAGPSGNRQLDKKFKVLSRVAYFMFRNGIMSVTKHRLTEIIAEYKEQMQIAVDEEALVEDLIAAEVLEENSSGYIFAQRHFFQYFVALYYSDRAFAKQDATLLAEVRALADVILDENGATILMFYLYLTQDRQLISAVVRMADAILQEEVPSQLEADIANLNEVRIARHPRIESATDAARNREIRREERDKAIVRKEGKAPPIQRGLKYSRDLRMDFKLGFAYAYVVIIGQIVRNFPGDMEGADKVALLRAASQLGLRGLRQWLNIFRENASMQRSRIEAGDRAEWSGQEMSSTDQLKMVSSVEIYFSRMWALGTLCFISEAVGLRDLEKAYRTCFRDLEHSVAMRLLDVAIRLEIRLEFPEEDIRRLHAQFMKKNMFADAILYALVHRHEKIYPLDKNTESVIRLIFETDKEVGR